MNTSPIQQPRKLDVDCGRQKVPGAVSLDCVPETDVNTFMFRPSTLEIHLRVVKDGAKTATA